MTPGVRKHLLTAPKAVCSRRAHLPVGAGARELAPWPGTLALLLLVPYAPLLAQTQYLEPWEHTLEAHGSISKLSLNEKQSQTFYFS